MKYAMLIWLLGGSALAEVSSVEELKPIQRAHEEVDGLKKNYRRALDAALKKSGPEGAIGSCRLDASRLKAAKSGNLTVGRTSHKLRNPSNHGPEWVKPILASWVKRKRGDIPKEELVDLGGGKWGYVEPIFVEPVCLNCHGAHLTPMMQKTLKATYPEDQATGFSVGDLRGVLWLESAP